LKFIKLKKKDLIFLIILALLVIPQTRQPIQIGLHSLLAKFGPDTIDVDKRKTIEFANWQLKDQNNNHVNFKELRGKVIFINFWATWCPPCIAEMPSIQALYNDYKDSVEFLLVSDEANTTISHFLSSKGYQFQVFNSTTYVPNVFETTSIPRTYIINSNGEVVIDKNGAANWNSSTVRQLLDQMIKESKKEK